MLFKKLKPFRLLKVARRCRVLSHCSSVASYRLQDSYHGTYDWIFILGMVRSGRRM